MIDIKFHIRIKFYKPMQPWYMSRKHYEGVYLQEFFKEVQLPAARAWIQRNHPEAVLTENINTTDPRYGEWIIVTDGIPTEYGPYEQWDSAQRLVDEDLNQRWSFWDEDVSFKRFYYCEHDLSDLKEIE